MKIKLHGLGCTVNGFGVPF